MKIVWDERKRLTNREKHGLDFVLLEDFDWQKAQIAAANPSSHGQRRWKATGLANGMMVSFIFATLGSEAIAVISLRPASANERREYEWSRSTRH